MRKIFVLAQLFLSFTLLNTQAQTRGFITARLEAKDHVALVIGNSAYPDNPLANPVNDATDVAATFTDMGFIVEKVLDADKEQMAEAVNRFSARLRTAKAAVFYYAGHGMQVNGENYLIPIGRTPSTQISTEAQVPLRAFNAGEVLTAMEQAKVNFAMVVLDACRNNPLKGGGRGSVPGLASINAPAGSLVLYSTKAGTVASDGAGTRNSPFTTAFIKHIKTPGLVVNDLPMEIINTVEKATNNAQSPGAYTMVKTRFAFVPEITPEELKALKEKQLQGLQANLSEQEAHEAEIARKKADDDAIMARKKEELDAMDRQIAELRNRTNTGTSSDDDLDKMLETIKKREAQQREIEALERAAEEQRKKAETERQIREKEIAAIKQKELEAKKQRLETDLAKYQQIASSEYGKDMAQPAWDNILTKWGQAKGSITMGNSDALIGIVIYNWVFFTDPRDNKTYKTVKIGNQTWMAENLAYKPGSGNYWAYDNNQSNVAKYGYLYDWETAKNVCPTGWHLPSDEEWMTLEMHLGMSQSKANETGWRGSDEGRKLKSKTDWNNNGNGTDEFGFSALPGGYRNSDGNFANVGNYGDWWSSTQSNTSYAWGRFLYYYYGNVGRGNDVKLCGFSVRCLRD